MAKKKKEIKLRGYVPLSGLFMATALIGFMVSLLWIYPSNLPWGITMLIFFGLMIIASFVSTSHANPVSEDAFRGKK